MYQKVKVIYINRLGFDCSEPILVNFLKYVKADLTESTKDFGDVFVDQIQKSVRNVKVNREMEAIRVYYDVISSNPDKTPEELLELL